MIFFLNFFLIRGAKLNEQKSRFIILDRLSGEDPSLICKKNNLESFIANSEILPELMQILKDEQKTNAYVNGWYNTEEGHVIHSNGAVAPFDIQTNNTKYVFCMKSNPPVRRATQKSLISKLRYHDALNLKIQKKNPQEKNLTDFKNQERNPLVFLNTKREAKKDDLYESSENDHLIYKIIIPMNSQAL